MLLLEMCVAQLVFAAWLEQVIGNHCIAPFPQAEEQSTGGLSSLSGVLFA